jgi:transposase
MGAQRRRVVAAGGVEVEASVTGPPVEFVARVAGLDIGKAQVTVCVRVPSEESEEESQEESQGASFPAGRRRQVVREYSTMSRQLLALADWLRIEGVEVVVMEATGSYWKPVYYLLEAEGLECELVNSRQIKNLPGRPKTDKLDAVWLAKVAERGMCGPSLVHPQPIRALRDLTRYRRSLVREQTREKQRLEKLLEDAQIKLSSVISDIFGVSGRLMLEAMIGGQRNPRMLAQLARGSMRTKISVLEEALTGHFEDHHAYLARRMLDRIDALDADVAGLDDRIEQLVAPFQNLIEVLDEIPGVGRRTAQELIGEIGIDMTRFPTAGHLVSWAKFAPIAKTSAGRGTHGGSTGKGNPWLAATLGEAAAGAARTHTFLGERYRRLVKRRGKDRTTVAVGNSILKITWELLSDPTQHFHDLGYDWYDSHHHANRRKHELIRQLQALTGQRVTLQPVA